MSTNKKDGEKRDDSSDYNPKLDFLSVQFDPLLALNTPGVAVPVPTAKTYDNIGVYKSAQTLPKPQERGSMKRSEAEPGPSTSSGSTIQSVCVQRRWLPHQLPIQSTRKVEKKNLFTKMAGASGPLALLKKCVDQRLKIKVHNRRGHEYRGYCIGYVTLFDKHWNIVLEEVYEEWERERKRRTIHDNGAQRFKALVEPPEIDVKIKAKVKGEKRRETCSRRVHRVVMRGEQISHIVVLDENQEL